MRPTSMASPWSSPACAISGTDCLAGVCDPNVSVRRIGRRQKDQQARRQEYDQCRHAEPGGAAGIGYQRKTQGRQEACGPSRQGVDAEISPRFRQADTSGEIGTGGGLDGAKGKADQQAKKNIGLLSDSSEEPAAIFDRQR